MSLMSVVCEPSLPYASFSRLILGEGMAPIHWAALKGNEGNERRNTNQLSTLSSLPQNITRQGS